MLWVVMAVVAFAAWKLSRGHKIITISAAIVAAAVVYIAAYPASLSASSDDPHTTQQTDH